jgi:hypothetical protein
MTVEHGNCLEVWTVGRVVAKSRSSSEAGSTDRAMVGTCSWMEVRDTGVGVAVNCMDAWVVECEVVNIQQMSSLIQMPVLGWLGGPLPCWTWNKH